MFFPRTLPWFAGALGVALFGSPRSANAAELDWKGYTWSITNGGMAGVAAGSSANVSVDANGYLHLKIQKNGDTWTAAEIFTTTRLGFGTYQWQIDGPIDTFDKNVVLGLFPYGPADGIGSDGTNEIDIEYSRWGQANGPNGDWTNYPASGKTIGELSYTFSLSGGALSTSRFIWTKDSIEDFLFAGLQPPTSTASLIKTWKYSPTNPSTNIPQQALPLGMNLWCFGIPSDGKNVEIVVRDFQFVPEGTSVGGAGGSAGMSSASGGVSGSSAASGGSSRGGSSSFGGGSSRGGSSFGGGSSRGGSSFGGGSSRGGSSSGGGSSRGGSSSSGGTTSVAGGPSLAGNSGLASGGAGGGSATAGAATVSHGGALSNAGQADSEAADQGSANAGQAPGCGVARAPRSSSGRLPWLFALLLLGRVSACSRVKDRRSSRARTY